MTIDAYTIPDFCRAHGNISRSTFYNLEKKGLAPRIMKVGNRRMISREAAEEFRRRCEGTEVAHEDV